MADSLYCHSPHVVYDVLEMSAIVCVDCEARGGNNLDTNFSAWKHRLAGVADEHMQELAFSISTSGSYTAQRQISSAMFACRKQRDAMTRSALTDLTVCG